MIDDNANEISKMELLRGLIQNGVPTFINNHSKVENSKLVEIIDPNCEVVNIPRFNSDELKGSFLVSNGNTFEEIYIKPKWLKRLEIKCKKEPDELHILLFDGLKIKPFFNPIKKFENDLLELVRDNRAFGRWCLPENARIVLAGTLDDDIIRDNLLFKYYYSLNIDSIITIDSFFTRDKIQNNSRDNLDIIHPYIFTYLLYKGYDFNEDLSKWISASNELYYTFNPHNLEDILGEEITRDFVEYCGQKVLSVENIVNGDYTDEDVERLTTKQKYLLIAILCGVADVYLDEVRVFFSKIEKEMFDLFNAFYSDNYKEVIELSEHIREFGFESVLYDFIRREYR